MQEAPPCSNCSQVQNKRPHSTTSPASQGHQHHHRHYGWHAKPSPPEPRSLKAALSSTDVAAWAVAWDAELQSHDQELKAWYDDDPLPDERAMP